MTEARRQRSDDRGEKTEVRRQRPDDRGQRPESRRPRTENRRQRELDAGMENALKQPFRA